jgi:hypothetical protein
MKSMKTSLRKLLTLYVAIATSHAFSQTRIVDQANEFLHIPSPSTYWNIEYLGPTGQEFTPTLTSLDFVELQLQDFYGYGYRTGTLAVIIHEGTINGPVLGTSTPVSLYPTFEGAVNFGFADPVPLVPGDTYVMQVHVLTVGDWGVAASGISSYPYGRFIQFGAPIENNDMFFREGITVVPEPHVLASLGLGLVVLSFTRSSRTRKHDPNEQGMGTAEARK